MSHDDHTDMDDLAEILLTNNDDDSDGDHQLDLSKIPPEQWSKLSRSVQILLKLGNLNRKMNKIQKRLAHYDKLLEPEDAIEHVGIVDLIKDYKRRQKLRWIWATGGITGWISAIISLTALLLNR